MLYTSGMVDKDRIMYRTLETIGIVGKWDKLIVNTGTGELYACIDTISSSTGISYWTVHTITYPVSANKVTVETPYGYVPKTIYTEEYMVSFFKKFKPDVLLDYLNFLSDFCQYPITYLNNV